MVAAFARAIAQNRTFVVPKQAGRSNLGFYWATDYCKQQSWLCYFHSFSKCDESHLGMDYMKVGGFLFSPACMLRVCECESGEVIGNIELLSLVLVFLLLSVPACVRCPAS